MKINNVVDNGGKIDELKQGNKVSGSIFYFLTRQKVSMFL